MTEFVRHHPGDLVVGARRLEHAPIQEHWTARERKRVDVALVHDIKRVSECRLTKTRRDGSDELCANPLDEILRCAIVQHWQLLPHLSRRLSSKPHVFGRRKAVSPWLDSRLSGKRRAQQQDCGHDERSMERALRSHASDACKPGTKAKPADFRMFSTLFPLSCPPTVALLMIPPVRSSEGSARTGMVCRLHPVFTSEGGFYVGITAH